MARVRGIKQRHPLGSVATRAGAPQLLTGVSVSSVASSTGVKISDLPAASSLNDMDELEVNQGGTTRRITLSQLRDFLA